MSGSATTDNTCEACPPSSFKPGSEEFESATECTLKTATCPEKQYLVKGTSASVDDTCTTCAVGQWSGGMSVHAGLAALVNEGSAGSTSDLGFCHGDCNTNGDCASGLTCFQRGGSDQVPGCAEGGSGDVSGRDYCIDELLCAAQTQESSCGPGEFWTSAQSAAADNTCQPCPANTYLSGDTPRADKAVWTEVDNTGLWDTGGDCPRLSQGGSTYSMVSAASDGSYVTACKALCIAEASCGGISIEKFGNTRKCELVSHACVSDPNRAGIVNSSSIFESHAIYATQCLDKNSECPDQAPDGWKRALIVETDGTCTPSCPLRQTCGASLFSRAAQKRAARGNDIAAAVKLS